MSSGLSSSSESSVDADDLLEIRERLKELAKEKDMLRDSKSHSFELIKKLEIHAKTLSKSREEDQQHIVDLERELCNCNQEIDYLRDQLNTRTSDLNCLGEQVCSLKLKLADMEILAEETTRLREQMKMSESETILLKKEIEDNKDVVNYSVSYIKRLEETISSMALEYQCEIEGTKLETLNMEQNLLETKKLLEERNLESSRINELIQDLELQIQDANKLNESLYWENRDLKEKLRRSDMNTKAFVRKIEEQFREWLSTEDNKPSGKLEEHISTYGNVLGPLFSRLASLGTLDVDLMNKTTVMSRQIDEYKVLIEKLKTELREEKLKAKEEAEELTQEMAELRYQLTTMLDEECKRRANIEQLSLQRIAGLEAQIALEQKKFTGHQDLVVRNQ